MTRFRSPAGVSAVLVFSFLVPGHAATPFDQKLPADRQALHVLSRLTFGPRPGDLEQIRRLGIDKWIDQQLHPELVADPPALEAKLKLLSTIGLPMWEILDKYPSSPLALRPLPNPFNLLTPQQSGKLMNCSVDEREATLAALDPDTRRLVLAGASPQVLEGLPEEIRQEAAALRRADQEERSRQVRMLTPPLNTLLNTEQLRTVTRGTREEKLALLGSFDADTRRKIVRALPQTALMDLPELRRVAASALQPQQFVHFELVEHKLQRAIYSNRQLEEVLVDFWMNHFNVFNGKGQTRVYLTTFERDAIRPHVFGRFRDMLLATARHPAMLYYLDNWYSQVPRDDAPTPPGTPRRPGLNENYGRELLELHTLGVDGGYTQDDVIAVARAFSGWTIFDTQRFAEFQFNPGWHDRKEKIVLGHRIPAMGAEQDGLQVIDILSRHPSTAAFISKKLAQRFVADTPPPALVERMAATFTRTDGDLRAVLQTLFASAGFRSEGAWRVKVKSPLELVVSAVRAVDGEVTDAFALAQKIADLGQPLYGKLEPTGYPNTGEAWTNTASLLGRINFATALTSGQVPGAKVDVGRFTGRNALAVAADLLRMPPPAAMLAAIDTGLAGQEATPSLLASLVIGSPEFQRR